MAEGNRARRYSAARDETRNNTVALKEWLENRAGSFSGANRETALPVDAAHAVAFDLEGLRDAVFRAQSLTTAVPPRIAMR